LIAEKGNCITGTPQFWGMRQILAHDYQTSLVISGAKSRKMPLI
jgi:hypothetical protein